MTYLFEAEKNKLTSMKGDVSYFYEFTPPDLNVLSINAVSSQYKRLETILCLQNEVIKVYAIDGKYYFNIFSERPIADLNLKACHRPVEVFFKERFCNLQDVRVHFYENYLTYKDQYVRLLSVKNYGTQIYPLESLNFGDYVIQFKKVSKLDAKKKINFKRKLHFSSLFKGMRDLDGENAFNESEDLLNGITRDESALYLVEMFFLLSETTKLNLDNKTDQFTEYFKGQGGEVIIEERGMNYFFESLVPGIIPSFKRAELLPSNYLSHLVPFHRDFLHESGFSLQSSTQNPVLFNLFHPTAHNYNALITGPSGQGKSVLANKILKEAIRNKAKAVVLDLGNSFYKNVKYHEGIVISEKFNPLEFQNPRYLKEFILSFLDTKFSKKEEGRLYETIEIILRTKVINSFADFLLELEKGFEGITYYFKEALPFFNTEKTQMAFVTYCDFSLYPESLKAPLIIYLIEYFKNLDGRKVFIFDECWHLLEKNSVYLAECFRTFRKHEASAIAISQNLDDFSGSQLGRVIMQNTYHKFLFHQQVVSSEFIGDDVAQVLQDIESVKYSYSEFLYLCESIKKTLRYYPTNLEYQLFTSDKKDLNQWQKYFETEGQFLNFGEAITNFTKIKYAGVLC